MINKFAILHAAPETGEDGYVLCTMQPFYMGSVQKFRSEFDYMQALANYNGLLQVAVDGYMVLIQYAGTLDDRKVPVDGSTLEEIKRIFQGMADHYRNSYINAKPGIFSRYKLVR